MMNRFVYDIETFSNCFTTVFINIETEEIHEFVIHESRDDRVEFNKFLREQIGLIGYNNIGFDGPVIEFFMRSIVVMACSSDQCAKMLYDEAQRVIDMKYPPYRDYQLRIPQIDLFLIHHFNNVAKFTSLKKCEFNMRFHNMMDMPKHHSDSISKAEVADVLRYNKNDVLATFELYKRSSKEIKIRMGMNEKYSLNCINFNDTKIGERLLLQRISKRSGIPLSVLFKARSPRDVIKISDVIFDYVEFSTKEFQHVLNEFRKVSIIDNNTKGVFDIKQYYDNFRYDFGSGGIHGCIKPGVYEADEDYMILDIDVNRAASRNYVN